MRETDDPTAQLLARARSGDAEAFAELIRPFRRELQVHCYRILGSAADAEDMTQETLMAAWRGLGRFEERSSLRTWLHAIAANKCLNHLRATRGSPLPAPEVPLPEPTRSGEPLWLEPYPDVLLGDLPDAAPGPEARYEARESVSLAFITALQHLPPRQRAALVLRDVLGFRASETAAILGCTGRCEQPAQAGPGHDHRPPASQAGATTRRCRVLRASSRSRSVCRRVRAWRRRGDRRPAHRRCLAQDAAAAAGVPGPRHDRAFPGRRLVPPRNPAVPARSHPGKRPARLWPLPARPPYPVGHAHGLIVLTLAGERISAITGFNDNSVLARFGLPRTLPE